MQRQQSDIKRACPLSKGIKQSIGHHQALLIDTGTCGLYYATCLKMAWKCKQVSAYQLRPVKHTATHAAEALEKKDLHICITFLKFHRLFEYLKRTRRK